MANGHMDYGVEPSRARRQSPEVTALPAARQSGGRPLLEALKMRRSSREFDREPLAYVADLSRMDEATPEEKAQYSGPDAGFIAQNVYLFCASEGLATVVRGMVDRDALAKIMGLSPQQRIILAQSVGYPAAH